MEQTYTLSEVLTGISSVLKEKIRKYDAINPQDFSSIVLDIAYDSISPSMTDSIGTGLTNIENLTVSSGTIEKSAFKAMKGLTTVVFNDNLTTIGQSAFEDCTKLIGLTIPKNTTSIGSSAFAGCYAIEEIKVADGNSIYDSRDNCNAIIRKSDTTLIQGCKNTTIPQSVTKLGPNSFNKIKTIESIAIPEGVTEIQDGAFTHCENLREISLPKSLTTIKEYSFRFCYALTKFTVPNLLNWCSVSLLDYFSTPLTYNGGDLYVGDDKLVNLVFPEGLNVVKQYTFHQCRSIESATIHSVVESIGKGAFQGCTNLYTLSINEGDKLLIISDNAFIGCAFEDFHIPSSVLQVGAEAFKNTGWYNSLDYGRAFKDGWLLGFKEKEATNSQTVTSITIEGDVVGLSDSLFKGWALTSVTMSDGIKYIGAATFADCKSLTTLTIPSSVTRIGGGAFKNCTNLSEIDFTEHSEIPTLSGSYAFTGINNLNIYVKPELLDDWKNAQNWSYYAKSIKVRENI